jgi:hypothetical protein
MAKKTTLPEFQANLQKMAKDLGKAIRKPFREHQIKLRNTLYGEYWKHPLASKIWRWRRAKWNAKGGPSVKLGPGRRPRYPRWSQSNQAWIAPIDVWGLAAKVEKGGRLNRSTKGGDRRSAGAGLGTKIRRRPVFNRIVDREFDLTVRDVAESFGAFVERTL